MRTCDRQNLLSVHYRSTNSHVISAVLHRHAIVLFFNGHLNSDPDCVVLPRSFVGLLVWARVSGTFQMTVRSALQDVLFVPSTWFIVSADISS